MLVRIYLSIELCHSSVHKRLFAFCCRLTSGSAQKAFRLLLSTYSGQCTKPSSGFDFLFRSLKRFSRFTVDLQQFKCSAKNCYVDHVRKTSFRKLLCCNLLHSFLYGNFPESFSLSAFFVSLAKRLFAFFHPFTPSKCSAKLGYIGDARKTIV